MLQFPKGLDLYLPDALARGINMYAYVGNNPVNLTDPMGQQHPGVTVLQILLKRLAKWIGGGIADFFVGPEMVDRREADDDNDGIINSLADDDGDTVPNYRDPDSEYCIELCYEPPLTECH